jgi:hypothetical protein
MISEYKNHPTSSQKQMILSHCENKQSTGCPSSRSLQRLSQMNSFTKVSQMNLESTEEWIGNLGKSKGWSAVDTYADNFRDHSINGYIFDRLKVESLKSELGIQKHGHRMEIMAATNDLCTTPSRGGDNVNIEESSSSICQSKSGFNDLLNIGGRGSDELESEMRHLNRTAACLWTGKSAGARENFDGCSVSPFCSYLFGLSKHFQEIKKWDEPVHKSNFSARKWLSSS